jgi:hypothetical protein
MFKIAICGKANSGKNTLGKLISKELFSISTAKTVKYMAFADPVKEIALKMFPDLPRKTLFGRSELRSSIIPNAFKDGNPLTARELLLDIGTKLGRSYSDSVWINAFNNRVKKAEKSNNIIIVPDVRFRNEFSFLKESGFYTIRLLRDANLKINHISETDQDSIKDDEFDSIINNNGTIHDLKQKVKEIAPQIIAHIWT